MKTTIELSDAVLIEAKAVAQREGTTLRALIETGLRRVMDEKRRAQRPFVLRDASVGGGRMLAPMSSWEAVRDLIYEGRGS